MSAYYNELDPYVAQWLRNLIAQDLIAPGDVDERSITEVSASDLVGYSQCHFFAGIGGWPYALRLAGWPDDRPVWTGSCPCQPFSVAGKRAAQQDKRHLWPVFALLIAECRPPVVMGEQVASQDGLAWFDTVHSDLEDQGYACGAVDFCAAGIGAPHARQRLWWVAEALADTIWDQQPREESCGWSVGRVGRIEQPISWDEPWESALARFRVVDDGIPRSVAATDAARNAIVPQVAAEVIAAFMECRP